MHADSIIQKLKLQPHPEGGFFREIFRSEETLVSSSLPERYNGNRNFYTSIYFLLKEDQKSHFHKLVSDEIWFFHLGSSVKIHLISEGEKYRTIILGNDFLKDENAQFTIPKGVWFAAELTDKTSFGLISCVVVPGFEFSDFKLANKKELLNSFPENHDIISQLTLD